MGQSLIGLGTGYDFGPFQDPHWLFPMWNFQSYEQSAASCPVLHDSLSLDEFSPLDPNPISGPNLGREAPQLLLAAQGIGRGARPRTPGHALVLDVERTLKDRGFDAHGPGKFRLFAQLDRALRQRQMREANEGVDGGFSGAGRAGGRGAFGAHGMSPSFYLKLKRMAVNGISLKEAQKSGSKLVALTRGERREIRLLLGPRERVTNRRDGKNGERAKGKAFERTKQLHWEELRPFVAQKTFFDPQGAGLPIDDADKAKSTAEAAGAKGKPGSAKSGVAGKEAGTTANQSPPLTSPPLPPAVLRAKKRQLDAAQVRFAFLDQEVAKRAPLRNGADGAPSKTRFLPDDRAHKMELLCGELIDLGATNLRQAILGLDASVLDESATRKLLEFCPSASERQAAEDFVNTPGSKIESLDRAELLTLALISVPTVRETLSGHYVHLRFLLCASEISEATEKFKEALSFFASDDRLPKVLALLRRARYVIENDANDPKTIPKPKAKAESKSKILLAPPFRLMSLNSLLPLSDTPSATSYDTPSEGTRFLRSIAKALVGANAPTNAQASIDLKPVAAMAQQAACSDIEALVPRLAAISVQIAEAYQLLQRTERTKTNIELASRFIRADVAIDTLSAAIVECQTLFKAHLLFYGESRGPVTRRGPQWFGLIAQFAGMLHELMEEERARRRAGIDRRTSTANKSTSAAKSAKSAGKEASAEGAANGAVATGGIGKAVGAPVAKTPVAKAADAKVPVLKAPKTVQKK